jgi:hypothetical protein
MILIFNMGLLDLSGSWTCGAVVENPEGREFFGSMSK